MNTKWDILTKQPLILLLMMVAIGSFHGLEANAKKVKMTTMTYDIRCGGTATQGYYLVEVTVYVKKPKQIDSPLLRRCAVHGVLFKGFSGGRGCSSQRPLAGSASVEQEHEAYFFDFFQDGGGYATYASLVDGSTRTIKEGKRYKVTALLSVSKELLRQDLEKAGVIRGLNSGF